MSITPIWAILYIASFYISIIVAISKLSEWFLSDCLFLEQCMMQPCMSPYSKSLNCSFVCFKLWPVKVIIVRVKSSTILVFYFHAI